jgi:hypothetical protein
LQGDPARSGQRTKAEVDALDPSRQDWTMSFRTADTAHEDSDLAIIERCLCHPSISPPRLCPRRRPRPRPGRAEIHAERPFRSASAIAPKSF